MPAYAELRGHVPPGSSWGVFRDDPERGTANFAGAAQVLDAVAGVRARCGVQPRPRPRRVRPADGPGPQGTPPRAAVEPRRVARRRAARVLPAGHLPGRRPAAPPGVGLRLLQRGGRRRHPGRNAGPGRPAVGREAHRRARARRRHRGTAGRRGHPARPPRRARSRRRHARPGAPRAGRAGPSRRPGPRPHRVDPMVPRRRRRACAPRSATGDGPPGSGRAASCRSGCGTTRSRCSPPTPSPSRCFPWCPTARISTPRRRTPG